MNIRIPAAGQYAFSDSGRTQRTLARNCDRFQRCLHLALILLMLCCGQSAHAQPEIVSNLLVNGSFDSDLAGWELESTDWLGSIWSNEGNDAAGSFRGTQNEFGGYFTELDLAKQCVSVEAGEVYQLRSSAKMRSDNQVDGHIEIFAAWPEAGCAETVETKFISSLNRTQQTFPVEFDGWLSKQARFRIPNGFSEVRIALSVVAYQDSDEEDRFGAYFDDISFGKVRPDLVAGIDFSGQSVAVGSEITFDVSISNKNGLFSMANDITARVLSEKRLRLVSESCPGDMVNFTEAGTGWIRWFNIPSLEAGETHNCTITAELQPGSSSAIFPSLEVDCPECDHSPHDNSASDELNITPMADIKATLTAQPYQSIEGRISVHVELENLGTKSWNELVWIKRPPGAVLDSPWCLSSPIFVNDAENIYFKRLIRPSERTSCTVHFKYPTPETLLTFQLRAESLIGNDSDLSNSTDETTLTTVSLLVNYPSIDRGDSNPGDGVCFTPFGRDGICTLRGAIEEANALPGFQVVMLPYTSNGYPLSLAGGDQHISITDTVGIWGELQDIYVPKVFGNWTDTADRSRIFVIDSPTGRVELKNLDLVGQGTLMAGNGGIVRINNTEVKMYNVVLEDGGANGRGGALYSNDNMRLELVFVSGSKAPFGAGIAFEPTAMDSVFTLVRSRIHNNSQTPFSPQSQGGGIWADGGEVSINESSIDNNFSTRGGGLALSGGALARIENSTFSTNEADVAGGGVWVSPGTVVINFSTFAHNSADSSSDMQGEGGGVFASASSTVGVINSIFTNNEGQADGILPKGSTCYGSMTSGGYNTFTPSTTIDADCAVNVNSGDNNSFQAVLAALAPTEPRKVPFHNLLAEGQEVDLAAPDCKALDNSVLINDQRLLVRPVDGNQSGTARCDKGAVEARNGFPELSVVCPSQVSVEAGSTTTVSCAVTSVNGAAGNVYFSCIGAPPSCDFAPEPLALSAGESADVDVTIHGNGTSLTSTITVFASVSPANGRADIEVTTTGELGGDDIMINATIIGSGSIVSSPAFLDCNVLCSESFPMTGAPIELTANPAAGWKFSAWTGACAGAGTMLPNGSSLCTVTSSADRTLAAVFVEDTEVIFKDGFE